MRARNAARLRPFGRRLVSHLEENVPECRQDSYRAGSGFLCSSQVRAITESPEPGLLAGREQHMEEPQQSEPPPEPGASAQPRRPRRFGAPAVAGIFAAGLAIGIALAGLGVGIAQTNSPSPTPSSGSTLAPAL